MTSQLGTHYKGAILLFTFDCKTSEMEGTLNLETEEKSWLTVLCCRRPNKVSCKNHSNTRGISMYTSLKEAKRKQNGRPSPGFTDWPANGILCLELEAFWSIVFQQKSAYWDTSGFQEVLPWERFSTISIREPKNSLDTDYPRNEGSLANGVFSRKTFFGRFFGPYRETSVSKIPLPPPKSISCRIG